MIDLQRIYRKLKPPHYVFFRYVIWICALVVLSVALVYAYLGIYSYYLADDYCEAARVENASSPVMAVLERYTAENWPRATMRYSNLLFVGMGESLGKNNLPLTISVMILLWFAGLVLSVRAIRILLKVDWEFQVDLFLGLIFGFFSLLQAPSLFQTIYWRSAMMTHFAPLVFGSFLFAFMIQQVRQTDDKTLSLPVYLLIFIASFFIAGFSEPPTTTMLTALPLLMVFVWFREKPTARRNRLALLAVPLAGAFAGLLTMLLSPASSSAAQEKTLDVVEILGNSFFYAYLFVVDSLKTQPLPTFISVIIPLLLIWLHRQGWKSGLMREQKRMIWIVILVIPLLAWVLIAAGFSPSVYGQSFPVERARFLARVILIAMFMVEGCLFGLLLGGSQFKPNPSAAQIAGMTVFTLVAIVYPLRAAANLLQYEIPERRIRAEWWHIREAYILRHAGMGERDIVIPGFSGVYQVKEIDNNPNHWVNRCAAQYYDVDSIHAFNMEDEYILEYLNE